jgi:hypothetical protein
LRLRAGVEVDAIVSNATTSPELAVCALESVISIKQVDAGPFVEPVGASL